MPSRKTQEQFTKEATKVHNGKFDYVNSVYINTKTKVAIICPIHGVFYQIPNTHLMGTGCPSCTGNARITLDMFNKRTSNSEYSYKNLPNTLTSKTVVTAVCGTHGNFKQTAKRHLAGDGCPKCAREATGKASRLTRHEAILRIQDNSSTLWDFSKFKYTSAHTKAIFTCPKHGDKAILPNSLFNGGGCSDCAVSGFNYKSGAILYYLKIKSLTSDKFVYKIGITNSTIKDRYLKRERDNFEVLATLKFRTGAACKKAEQAILNSNKEFKYKGPPLLKTGNTELFIKDVLPLFRN